MERSPRGAHALCLQWPDASTEFDMPPAHFPLRKSCTACALVHYLSPHSLGCKHGVAITAHRLFALSCAQCVNLYSSSHLATGTNFKRRSYSSMARRARNGECGSSSNTQLNHAETKPYRNSSAPVSPSASANSSTLTTPRSSRPQR